MDIVFSEGFGGFCSSGGWAICAATLLFGILLPAGDERFGGIQQTAGEKPSGKKCQELAMRINSYQ
jgi:hypothetical protein